MKKTTKTIFAYSFAHFVVDFLCVFTIFSILKFHPFVVENMLFYIVLYGLIAFGTQFIFGEICDRIQKPKLLALLGISLNLVALFVLFVSPLFATIITGFGNALFHVGGGVISLYLGKNKATIPGIFVSTGAMGVFLGTFLPLNYSISVAYLAVLAIFMISILLLVKIPKIKYEKIKKPRKINLLLGVCIFALLAIGVRSIIGFIVPFPWKVGFILPLIFTFGVIFGKALGGFLADKFGFEEVGIISLAISSILLSFFSSSPILGILGIFLFNMTMPITLVALANSFGGRKGFAFGLTTLALIIGALPYYAGVKFASSWVIFALIILSLVFVWLGMQFYKKLFKS